MWARRPLDSHLYCLVPEAFLLYSLEQWPLTPVSTVLLIQSLQNLLGDWHNASKPLQAASYTASCLWKQLQESTFVIVKNHIHGKCGMKVSWLAWNKLCTSLLYLLWRKSFLSLANMHFPRVEVIWRQGLASLGTCLHYNATMWWEEWEIHIVRNINYCTWLDYSFVFVVWCLNPIAIMS